MEEQNNSTSVCTECCHDNPDKFSPNAKIVSTASGSIPPIHDYLFNNIAMDVDAVLSPLLPISLSRL